MNHLRKFKEYKELKDILDTPILIFENYNYCYTDLEAVKQFYKDMYAQDYDLSDKEELDEYEGVCDFIDKQSLESFARPGTDRDWYFNTYFDSLRDAITDFLSEEDAFNFSGFDPQRIYYEDRDGYIIVPIEDTISEVDSIIEDMQEDALFGVESCIGEDIIYDDDMEAIKISADFSNLNAPYEKG